MRGELSLWRQQSELAGEIGWDCQAEPRAHGGFTFMNCKHDCEIPPPHLLQHSAALGQARGRLTGSGMSLASTTTGREKSKGVEEMQRSKVKDRSGNLSG